MSWFTRNKEGITTTTEEKLEVPEGLWWKCPSCKKAVPTADLKQNTFICPSCNYHLRINSVEYFEILFDNNVFKPLFETLRPIDRLQFKDLKTYSDRLEDASKKVTVTEAISIAAGKINDQKL
ncbi:MAG: acetyl-CoA carboxylase carboxyl transferase subunit beta, partial [Chitinophagales bacterium]|nr:acetyl-CoA carboxylase carboxyl transferase subunit beta [Chitinophagales bacterium]